MSAERADGPLRVGMIGTGMVAELHARAIREAGHLELVAVSDIDEARARRHASDWGVEFAPSADALINDDRIRAILILTPTQTHASIAESALSAGRHVLIEKPVGTPQEIARLEQAAAERGLVCMPGHNYAYQPEFESVRRLVRDGTLGHVRALWITYILRHPEEVARHYGGVLDEIMIHHTYLALALLGKPESVFAGRMDPAWETHPADDQAWMTWHYPKGLSAHLFASFAVDDCTSDPWMFQVKVLGDRGGADYNWHSAVYQRPLGSLPFAIPAYEDSYIHEHQAFASAIAGRRSLVSPLADAKTAALITEGVNSWVDSVSGHGLRP